MAARPGARWRSRRHAGRRSQGASSVSASSMVGRSMLQMAKAMCLERCWSRASRWRRLFDVELMDTMAMTITDVRALETQHVLQNYKRQNVVFVRGEGVRLIDEQGRGYLDFLSGIGVASLGHGHGGLAEALADQSRSLIHTSNLFFHPLQGELAARLSALTGLDRAFFCNSGTEAVEACLKFARRYWHTKGETTRTKYVAF